MKRCTIIISDSGPISSLWVADRLDLLIVLGTRIIVVDALYDELTRDLACRKDIEIKDFIASNSPPFLVATTDIGEMEREKRLNGKNLKNNAPELAIVDFLSSENGLDRHLRADEPVVILFEDANLKVFNRPTNLQLISTVGFLHGLEHCGVLASAEELIEEMRHPISPGRTQRDARGLIAQLIGTEEDALLDCSWMA